MKIVDHAGNEIKVGRLLRWQHNIQQAGPVDFYVKVKDVVAPTDKAPGRLVIELTLGVSPQVGKADGAVQFRDFVTVLDPEEDARAEAVLDKAPKVMVAR